MNIHPIIPPPIISTDTIFTKVKDLRPFMKNVNITVLVFERVETNWTKDNHSVHVIRVADETGSVLLTLFDAQGAAAKPGDILRILCGFVTLFKKAMRLACKVGTVHRVGRVKMVAFLQPDLSQVVWEGESLETMRARLPAGADEKLLRLASELGVGSE